MTNLEYILKNNTELIRKLLIREIAMNRNTGELDLCHDGNTECFYCEFSLKEKYGDINSCKEAIETWLDQEHKEVPSIPEDTPVDTKILVRNRDNGLWKCRYLAKIEDGKVYAWSYGATSFSVDLPTDYCRWDQAKLYEERKNFNPHDTVVGKRIDAGLSD